MCSVGSIRNKQPRQTVSDYVLYVHINSTNIKEIQKRSSTAGNGLTAYSCEANNDPRIDST